MKGKNSGITLITLIVTIIILLLLAGISIATLSGDDGVVDQTLVAKENARGSSVIDELDLYRVNFETGRTTATKEEKINELEAKELLTAEEAETLKAGGTIKVGTLSISFEMEEVLVQTAPDVSLGYIVEFCDYDGTILKKVNVNEGETAVYDGEIPTRAETEEFSYTFDKWVTEKEGTTAATLNNINSDKKVYAGYNRKAIYKVTFHNYDGTPLAVAKVNEGEAATFSGTPVRTATEDFTFEFTNWMTTQYGTTVANLSNVQKSQSVYASYEAISIITVTSTAYSPTDVRTGSNPVVFTTNIKKPIADEKLTFTYKFYGLSFWTGEKTTHYETIDTIQTTTSTTSQVTVYENAIYAATQSADRYLVTVEITDEKGRFKASEMISPKAYLDGYYTFDTRCLPAGTMVSVIIEEEDENGKKRKRRKQKKIEDLTYDDNLVVWDFDNGCLATVKPLWLMKKHEATEYNLLKFSDGTELKTIRQHRIFNKELGKFTYPMSDETLIGTTTFKEDGTEVTLVSKEIIKADVEYYNVISNYHMNVFAEGILTSCRLSNLYEIKDMKYVKDDRELARREEYREVSDEYFYGLRIAEQPKEINKENDVKIANSLKEYVRNLIDSKK